MNVRFMRWVDLHVGRIIANILSIFVRSYDVLPHKDIKKIVVSKYFGLGSITLSTPLLQAIKEHFPDAKVYFLTFKQNAELLKLYPFIDEVVTIRSSSIFSFISDTVKTSLFFLRSKIDLFIDMEFFSHYSAMIALFSGSGCRVGFHSSLLPKGKLLTNRVMFNPHRYVTEAFSELGRKVGAENRHPLYNPDLTGHEGYVPEWMSGNGLNEYEYITINANASEQLGALKVWVQEKWTELITRIVKEHDTPIILTGVKEDHAKIEEIVTPLPPGIRQHVYNTAGQFNFQEFLFILNKTKVLITVDSGPLHFAQSMGIPCLSLFGPETPTLYGPRGDLNRTVYLGFYCSPCYNALEGKKGECTNPVYRKCMENIEVDSVWHNFISLINVIEKKNED
jgi:ADP-heptose:LPS heptosyltransferase